MEFVNVVVARGRCGVVVVSVGARLGRFDGGRRDGFRRRRLVIIGDARSQRVRGVRPVRLLLDRHERSPLRRRGRASGLGAFDRRSYGLRRQRRRRRMEQRVERERRP